MKRFISLLQDFIGIITSIGRNPLEYEFPQKSKTVEQRKQEYSELDEEIKAFRKEVGNRLPHQWTLGEGACYESIRRREAVL